MEKIKKVVREEVEAVQITKEEFIEVASKGCAKLFKALMEDDFDGAMFVSETCAKFSAYLVGEIFDENDKNEEREEN